jgi:hypothetical protein
MDAPIYPPAAAFEQPIASPYVLSLDDASIAELMSVSAAWAIIIKYLPSLRLMVASPQLKPHLGDMNSVRATIRVSSRGALAMKSPGRNSPSGIELQWQLTNEVHRLDWTRPVTAAIRCASHLGMAR